MTTTRINRKEIELHQLARNLIQDRLRQQVNHQSLDAVLAACGVNCGEREKATALVDVLRLAIGLPTWIPPSDIPLGELLRVDASELQTDNPAKLDNRPEIIEPFTYDIVEHLLSIGEKIAWRQRWEGDANFPHDDDELGDFIMNMTLCQFIGFFLPMISSGPAKN